MPFRPAALLIAALLLAALGHPSDPQPAAEPPPGQLLIASAQIEDPRFRHSVVLLLRHDASGAFGIIINRPLGERPIAELLAGGKHDEAPEDAAIEGTIPVFFGGPVEPTRGFVVHGTDYRRAPTLSAGEHLAMTADKEVLRDIAHHQGPAKYLFAAGYAGWGPGQLEGEIARRDWFTAPADPALVFDADRETLWDTALARRTREL